MTRSSLSASETGKRWHKGLKWLFLGVLTAFIILLLHQPDLRNGLPGLLLILDIAAGEQDSLLKRITPIPTRTPVTYSIKGKTYSGDLYRSAEQSRAGILLIPGAAEGGKDDARLVAFANTLARGKFTVLVPDLVGMKKLQVGSENIQEITDSFIQLEAYLNATSRKKGGICAFSYAVGPAILASLSPEIRSRVCFVMGIGGYYDLSRVMTFFTTGYFKDQSGRWLHRNPNEYGKWVFVMSNLGLLSNEKDRQLFRSMAKRKMDRPVEGVDDLANQLGNEGKCFYNLITNRDPSRVPLLIAYLPERIRREISALDLSNKNLSSLKAGLILVHGLDDDIIPYTESVALARALPPGQARLFLAKGLFHVDVKTDLWEGWQLWRSVVALLEARDREGCN
ncbi:MAG TPA: hypothetical protein VGJ93_01005 [Desulfuromonadaceae bacterium]|jgi:hypothetical protein